MKILSLSPSFSLPLLLFHRKKKRIVRSIWDESESDGKDGKKLFYSEKREEKEQRREMIRRKKGWNREMEEMRNVNGK